MKACVAMVASAAFLPLMAAEPSFAGDGALGFADENGNFVLTDAGKRLSEKQKGTILPEARHWGLQPLGGVGMLEEVLPAQAQIRRTSVKVEMGGETVLADGEILASVVVPDDPLLSRLAEEFAWHLETMTGRKVLRLAAVPRDGVAVVFGGAEAAVEFGVDFTSFGEQTAVIRSCGNRVYVGGRSIGASHALTFALESLGCRYLWPGRTGKVIPKRDRVTFSVRSLTADPDMAIRRLQREWAPELQVKSLPFLGIDVGDFRRAYEAAEVDHAGNRNFWNWHGIGDAALLPAARQYEVPQRRYRWGHAFGDYRKRFLADRPEWFALQRDGSRGKQGLSLCLANEDLARQVADDILNLFKAHPEVVGASVCLPDGDYSAQCMCEACRRLDPANAPPTSFGTFVPAEERFSYVSLTDRVLHFSNRVAEFVTEKMPDRRLCLFAYSRYNAPPVKVRPHPALVIVNVAGSLADASTYRDNLAAWSRFGNMQTWRPNLLIGFRATVPQLYARFMFDAVEFAKANGVVGFEVSNMNDQWACKGFTYYAVAKAMLNYRGQTFDEVADDFCRAGFGRAASSIRRYLDAVERASRSAVAEVAGRPELGSSPAAALGGAEKTVILMDALEREGASSWLSKAVAETAGDEEAFQRVRFFLCGLDMVGRYRALSKLWKEGDVEQFKLARESLFKHIREVAFRDPFALFPAPFGTPGAPFMRSLPKKK